MISDQGLYSLSGKTSHRQMSRSLEAARLDLIMIVSLRNLTGFSAALLPRCLLFINMAVCLDTYILTVVASKSYIVCFINILDAPPPQLNLLKMIGWWWYDLTECRFLHARPTKHISVLLAVKRSFFQCLYPLPTLYGPFDTFKSLRPSDAYN